MPVWVTALATLVGAILGAGLRPIAENIFERRSKTLRLTTLSKVIMPQQMPPGMIILRGEEKFRQFEDRLITINNPTGRTLRDIKIIIDLEVRDKLEPGLSSIFEAVVRPTGGSKATSGRIDNNTSVFVQIEYFEPRANLEINLFSTLKGLISFYSSDDIEIKTHYQLEMLNRWGNLDKWFGILISILFGIVSVYIAVRYTVSAEVASELVGTLQK